MSGVAVSRHRLQDDDTLAMWWVMLVAVLALAVGYVAAMSLDAISNETPQPSARFVEFRKVDVQCNGGLVVLSFDLEAAAGDLAHVERHKSALLAHFKAALTRIELDSLYSRAGKESLSEQFQRIADRELGGDVVAGVYFGDFKIYSH